MRHFTSLDWAEFVASPDAPTTRPAMFSHLAGCSRCQRTVEVLRGIVTLAAREPDYEPPDRAIRYAKAIYSMYRPEKSGLARLFAQLVHDSSFTPLPAGIRSEDRLSRHLVYQAESYYLDLQLEYQPSGRVTLIGQLADQSAPPLSTADVPVSLMEGGTLMATTVCNRLGEFHLECASSSRDLRLYLPLPTAGKQLEVPLSEFHPDYRIPGELPRSTRRQSRRRPSDRQS